MSSARCSSGGGDCRVSVVELVWPLTEIGKNTEKNKTRPTNAARQSTAHPLHFAAFECGFGIWRADMLETIAIILIVLWLLGVVSGYTMGNFICRRII